MMTLVSFLAASVTKPLKQQGINLIPFDKFSSYQKLLCVTSYMLCLLPSHENGSIANPVKLDEAERHLQYLVQGESFHTDRWDLLTTNPLRGAAAMLSLLSLLGLMASSVLLINSETASGK